MHPHLALAAALVLAGGCASGPEPEPTDALTGVYFAQAADRWPVACAPEGVCVSIPLVERQFYLDGICPAE